MDFLGVCMSMDAVQWADLDSVVLSNTDACLNAYLESQLKHSKDGAAYHILVEPNIHFHMYILYIHILTSCCKGSCRLQGIDRLGNFCLRRDPKTAGERGNAAASPFPSFPSVSKYTNRRHPPKTYMHRFLA